VTAVNVPAVDDPEATVHATMTDGEQTARSAIGPVPASAARAWLGTARRTIVRLRDDARLGMPRDVVEDFAGLVELWERALPDERPDPDTDGHTDAAEPVFEWSGELPVERVRRLASHWAQVALLARDPASGIQTPPPEAAPFYDALVVAIANAVKDAPDPDHFADTFVDVVPDFDAPARASRPLAATTTTARRVLVVDDTDDIRLLMRLGLTRSGALDVCGEARDGAEALRRCDELDPDAVLLDVAMPVMDGLAALERLREDHPDTRVVMFSAAVDPAVRARATELGAHAFLAKDASIDDIERALLGEP
jgi:CheY-like chemotaxis protein